MIAESIYQLRIYLRTTFLVGLETATPLIPPSAFFREPRVDLQTSLVKGGRYELESHSGSINLSLPEQPGFELEAHTFSGRIRIDFPVKREGPIRDNDRGPRSVRGTYGDGSSSLRLQTFSGNLTVTRR